MNNNNGLGQPMSIENPLTPTGANADFLLEMIPLNKWGLVNSAMAIFLLKNSYLIKLDIFYFLKLRPIGRAAGRAS